MIDDITISSCSFVQDDGTCNFVSKFSLHNKENFRSLLARNINLVYFYAVSEANLKIPVQK